MFLLLAACSHSPTSTTPPAEDLHGRVDNSSGRDVVYLWGSREDIGYAEGSLYCDRVGPLFKDYLLEELVANHSEYTYDIARAYVLASTRFEDGDLAEIRAIYQGMLDHCTTEQLTITSAFLEPAANGSRPIELEDLEFANALADFGCSSFSVWGAASATGDTIHGRNFDWAIDPKGAFVQNHVIKVYDSTDEGARFLSVMVPGLVGCVSCVTEEGVALTMHNVSGFDPTYQTDISPRMPATRAAIAATYGATDVVDAAEQVLESRRQFRGSNLHLAFPLGRTAENIGAVVFEYDGDTRQPDGEVTVRRPGEDPDFDRPDAIVAANHYIKRSPPPTDGDSFDRTQILRRAIDQAVMEGGTPFINGQGMLRDVENGYSGVTAHSILLDTANRKLDVMIAADPVSPAPEQPAIEYDLDEVFGALP